LGGDRGILGDLYFDPEILSRIGEVYDRQTELGGRDVVEYPGLAKQDAPSQCRNAATGGSNKRRAQLGRREVANGTGWEEETFPSAFP
jgi:hypothetical protein